MGCWALHLQVIKGADAGECCNISSQRMRCWQSDCLLLASSWGSMGEDFGNLIKQTCTLPWGGGDPPCRWFFSIGDNWEATLGSLGRVGGFRQDLGGNFCASKASNVFNIIRTADISALSKYLQLHGNRQALWSSEVGLKKYVLWKVWCAAS